MIILIFTEGTILMHKKGFGLSREERVKESSIAGMQREASSIKYRSNYKKSEPGSIHDYSTYIPINNAVEKIKNWKKQKNKIYYMTSRRTKDDVEAISYVLKTNNFPDCKNLLFRKTGENYKDVVENLMPDFFIEDDCESIGGAKEMTSTNLSEKAKSKIKIYLVKEFEGIDSLPENLIDL
jgi:hypothetical protein